MRPERDEWLMQIAELVAHRGTCSRAQVGVVIAQGSRVLSIGYNGAPAGQPHCNHECNCGEIGNTWQRPEELGTHHFAECRTAQSGCQIAIHAEANAIAYAARLGTPLEGATLYSTMSPCVACAQLIIGTGIVKVFYRVEYRITDALSLLNESSIETAHLKLVRKHPSAGNLGTA